MPPAAQPSLQEQVDQLNARIAQTEHNQEAQLAAQRQDHMRTEGRLRAHLEELLHSQEQGALPRQAAWATRGSR